jgi:hypothetical protein
VRVIGIIFFALLAAQVALLLFAPPAPAPRPYQFARLTLALAMIACLVLQMGAERARRRRAKGLPTNTEATDRNAPE